MQRELLFFAGAKILSSAAILVFVQLLRWVERPVTVDRAVAADCFTAHS
jgi:hypothetical protein